MTFIDWSDSEAMFDLLLEFIRDEKNASVDDAPRQKFLTSMLREVMEAQELEPAEAIHHLRVIHQLVDPKFKNDPVCLHLIDFIEELERIR
jgi:hypothetical protein